MREAIRWTGAMVALVAALGFGAPAIHRFTTEIFFRNNDCGHALAVSVRGVRDHGGEVTAHTPSAIESGCRSGAWNTAAPGLAELGGVFVVVCVAVAWWVLTKRLNMTKSERTRHHARDSG